MSLLGDAKDGAKKKRNRLCNGSSAGDADEWAKEAKFMVSLTFDYFWNYINMVLRISPTANPSISNASPGSTTIV